MINQKLMVLTYGKATQSLVSLMPDTDLKNVIKY